MIEIPGYTIKKELGKGGMACVYLAVQKGLEREVALKVMSPALAADPSFGERFIREARIVAKLSHPQIVTVFDVGQHDNHNYIAMEYHNGGDLKDKIDDGQISIDEGITVIAKIAKALHFAHEQGYIHRDVKPENILFKSNGDPVLSDFGIAKATNSSTQMTQSGSVIGTPRYMSPEQARGKTADGRADIYSLGVIFHEILTGKLPYDGEDSLSIGIKHITDPIPKLPDNLKHYQPILDKFMAKQPDNRYQTGNEAAAALFGLQQPTESTQVFEPVSIESTVVMDSIAGTQVNPALESKSSSKKGLALGLSALVVGTLVAGSYFQPDMLPEPASEWIKVSLKGEPSKEEREKARVKAEKIAQLTEALQRFIQLNDYQLSDIKKAESDWRSLSNIDRNLPLIAEVEPKLQQRYVNFAKRYAVLYDFSQSESILSEAMKFGAQNDVYKKATAFISDRKRDELIQKSDGEFKAANYGEFTSDNTKLNELILLVQQAQNAETNGMLLEPLEDNAAYYYSEILKLEPNAVIAKQGLNRIANHFLDKARTLIANNAFAEANDAIDQAYGVNPSSPDIKEVREAFTAAHNAFKNDLEDSLAKQEAQNKMDDELAGIAQKASEALLSNRLTTPLKTSAYYYYSQMLKLDANNEIAKNGLSAIVSRYLKLADTAIGNDSFDDADNYIAQAYAVLPSDPRIEAAREKSSKANKDYLTKQLQIKAAAAKEQRKKDEAARLAKLEQDKLAQDKLDQEKQDRLKREAEASALLNSDKDSTQIIASQVKEEPSELEKTKVDNALAENASTRTELTKAESGGEGLGQVAAIPDDKTQEATSQPNQTLASQEVSTEQGKKADSAVQSVAAKLTPKQKFRIKILLQSAQRLLHNDRLISPKNNSAVFKYINVLQIDNNNKQAQAGMQNIVNRLNELADIAESEGRVEDAQVLHDSAHKLSEQFTFLQNDHQHPGE